MIKSVLSFILIFNMAIPAFAKCEYPVSYIKEGMPAFCTGWLYTDDANNQAAQDHADVKYYKLINKKLTDRQELQQKQNEILDKRLQLYMNQSHQLSQELQRQKSNSKWENVLWFSLGIVATGIAVYGAGQLK